MKKGIVLISLFFLFILFGAVETLAQDSAQITVKRSEQYSGVVLVTAVEGKASIELQCNQGMSGCTMLQPGNYRMLRLPRNQGTYDCANVHIFRKSADPEVGEKVGEYCLIEK